MIKILFLINTLGGGGAERVLVNLVNNMNSAEFDITVKTMFKDGVNASLLKKNIRYLNKNAPCPRGIAYLFKFIPAKILFNYFVGNEHFDVLVAYMHGAPVKTVCGCSDKDVKKVAWLHNGNPETGTFFKFWFRKKGAYKAYSQCDKLTAVSKSVADSFSMFTGINNISIVYNTNDVAKIKELSIEDCPVAFKNNSPVICSVGRLVKEKAYDRLINVAARLKKEGFDFNLVIVGDGEKRDELRKQVENLNASDYIRFTGYDANPYKYLRQSDIFVCSSYTEGLSTALTEAIILGLPCVSTNVSGAKEILGENNEYGIVTENSEQGIYEGIRKMLEDENIRRHYSQKATERSAFFNTENTVKQAEDLFKSLINNGAAFRVK